ncbi:TolC family outer membrane protein [Imbroritus primus]|uniref:TolC family outer membrane protein n=1 Tax=Imbroritus primus TaxID=3058603 RepID=A0ACD3SRY3_9BURK|nr:TolC family outer membrane protein [Burkholderiaceae bacterium PBA]
MSLASLAPTPLRAAVAALLLLSPLAHGADLLQVYHEAQGNDAQYASARFQAQAGQEALPQARSGLLPQISGSASLTRNEVDQRSPIRVERNGTSKGWSLNLTQPLFRWDRWETYKQGELQVAIADTTLAQASIDLITRVAEAYFNVLAAQDNLYLAGAQKDAISQQLEQAKRNFEVGTATITDTNEAQASYDLAVSTEIAARSALEVARATLQQITGKPAEELMGLRPGAPLPGPVPTDVNSWAQRAEDGNLQAIIASLSGQIAQRETKKARAGHLPTVDLVASRSYSSNSTASQTSTNLGGTRSDSSQIGVQVTIPLFSGGYTQSRVRETLALESKAASDYDFARRTAAQSARQYYSGVTNGLAQVAALEAAEKSALSSLESNRLGYEVGVRINIDVLNAQAQLFATRRDLQRARYDTILNGLRLKAAAGTLTEDDVVQINTLLTATSASLTALPSSTAKAAPKKAPVSPSTAPLTQPRTSGRAAG